MLRQGKERSELGYHLVKNWFQNQFLSHWISHFHCSSMENRRGTERLSIPSCLFWTTARKTARRNTLEIRRTYGLMCNHYAYANEDDLWLHLFFFLHHHPSLTAYFSPAGIQHNFLLSFNRRMIRLLTDRSCNGYKSYSNSHRWKCDSNHQQLLRWKMKPSRNI